jgi:hypothetical protein
MYFLPAFLISYWTSVCSLLYSDHDIVLLDVACKPVKPKPTRRKIFLWKKAEVHNIQKDIAEFGSTFQNETFKPVVRYGV